jgi:hypothetical protein
MAPPAPKDTHIQELERRIALLEAKFENSRKTTVWIRYKIIEVLKHLGIYTEKPRE